MKKEKLRKAVVAAMLAALAYIAVVCIRVPVVLFLSYEPKDVIVTIGGFILGPLASALISVVVSLVEMVTISSTGIIGCVMNVISTCSFSCLAAFIYKKKHSASGAVIGLVSGALFMTAIMLLWNYFITPMYMETPREAVAELLVPAFLPFNLLKGGLNAAITMLLYKPVVTGLRKAKLLPSSTGGKKSNSLGIALISLACLQPAYCLCLSSRVWCNNLKPTAWKPSQVLFAPKS